MIMEMWHQLAEMIEYHVDVNRVPWWILLLVAAAVVAIILLIVSRRRR
jgi:hypothetical protein